MKILAADHVLPISAPPIDKGAVVIDGATIVRVGGSREIAAEFPHVDIEDLGPAAIIPGLVNCHSHLEITAMRGALDSVEHDFSAWLLRLNSIRQGFSDADIRVSALAGAAEGAAAGVTCFGDIGRFGVAGFEALKAVGLRGVLFQETEFCVESSTADEDIKKLIEKFDSLRSNETDLVTVGISPHSPYTVGPRQLELIAGHAIQNGIKLTIHVGESADEKELLEHGTGFFPEIYKKYNVSWQSPSCSSIEYLERLGVLAAKPLLAHCVTISAGDLELIKTSGSTIAHCPKSNAKFGHGHAPLEAFLDSAISTGLGSDSVASNNLCDLLEESRFAALAARNRPGSLRFITAGEILESATLGGAKALGLDNVIGSLEAGKQADITVVALTHLAQEPVSDVNAALVFSSTARDVVRTIVAGETIYSDGNLALVDQTDLRQRLGHIIRS